MVQTKTGAGLRVRALAMCAAFGVGGCGSSEPDGAATESTGSSAAGGSGSTDSPDDGVDDTETGVSTGSGASTAAADSTGGAESSWHTLAPLPGGPRQETAVAAVGGRVYVMGGFLATGQIVADIEVYDPSEDAWSTARPLPEALHHAQVAVHEDTLYLLGSLRGLGFGQDGASWRYDSVADAWDPVAEMPLVTARGGGAAAALDDLIYVAGGVADGRAVADVWTYAPGDDVWLPVASLPSARDHLGLAAFDGLVYAIGGRSGRIGGHTARVDVYDPATDTWTDGPPMPTSRGGMAIGVTDVAILVAGGEGNEAAKSGVFDQLESFDPLAGVWETLPPMPIPRHGTGAAVVDGTLYIPGGAIVEALGAAADHEAWGP